MTMQMTDSLGAAVPGEFRGLPLARRALGASAGFWLLATLAGQFMFAIYTLGFYGTSALRGDMEAWNQVLPQGYVPGDLLGNLAVALHILPAVWLMIGGPLQLVPQLRNRFPAFHRWSGRSYVAIAVLASLTGIYMIWARDSSEVARSIGITINALLTIACGWMAASQAMARRFASHRVWAIRLFLLANGVWFFRIGLLLVLGINGGPIGFDPKTFTGPLLTGLTYGQFLLPLAVLELYLVAQARGGAVAKWAMAVGLTLLTLAMSAGLFFVLMGLWLPRL